MELDIRDPRTGAAAAILSGLAQSMNGPAAVIALTVGIELQRAHPAVTAEISRLLEAYLPPDGLAKARAFRDSLSGAIAILEDLA